MIGVQAQNLVPNSDLEQYSQYPDYVSQIDRAIGWSRPTNGTSDYLNACLGVPFSLSVPDDQFGYDPRTAATATRASTVSTPRYRSPRRPITTTST